MRYDSHIQPSRRKRIRRPGREEGGIAIMAVGALITICGFCGLAIDLSRVLNRKMELQNTANPAALAAVVELNGTKAGLNKAVQKAAATLALPFPLGPAYDYLEKLWRFNAPAPVDSSSHDNIMLFWFKFRTAAPGSP